MYVCTHMHTQKGCWHSLLHTRCCSIQIWRNICCLACLCCMCPSQVRKSGSVAKDLKREILYLLEGFCFGWWHFVSENFLHSPIFGRKSGGVFGQTCINEISERFTGRLFFQKKNVWYEKKLCFCIFFYLLSCSSYLSLFQNRFIIVCQINGPEASTLGRFNFLD